MSAAPPHRDLATGLRHAFKNYGLEPRPHQVRTVAKIIMDVASYQFSHDHEIRNYLIQHTAGSGKSLTIAALILCLSKLKNGADRRGFDLILVLTDRIVLDDQLSAVVMNFLKASHVLDVAQIDSKEDLRMRLAGGKKGIILTTFQKFMQLEKLPVVKRRRIAIVADEAHRTHGSGATTGLHEMLVESASQSELITYFSFTCSPTERTLEQFGTPHPTNANIRRPFYSYSVEESIRDGFTMDVISDFHAITEKDLEIDDLSKDPDAIGAKAKYLVNHFVSKSADLSNAEFKAKGMLIVKGRRNIIKYKLAIEEQVAKLPMKDRFDVICTFTALEEPPSIKETDVEVNGPYCDKDLTVVFKESDNNVKLIIVADKLQTGFDAPNLAIMYIDKSLKDANLVQTLGRLSRVAKGKTATCVVDFRNSYNDASAAFDKFSFEGENDKEIDDMIEHAHKSNEILRTLVNDLHGIKYEKAEIDLLQQIAREKSKFSYSSVDRFTGEPVRIDSQHFPIHKPPSSSDSTPVANNSAPSTPSASPSKLQTANSQPHNEPKKRFMPNLSHAKKIEVHETTVMFAAQPTSATAPPACNAPSSSHLHTALTGPTGEPTGMKRRLDEIGAEESLAKRPKLQEF